MHSHHQVSNNINKRKKELIVKRNRRNMASEQMSRHRDNSKDEKGERGNLVPKMTSHFETLASSGGEANKGTRATTLTSSPGKKENKSHEFVSLSDKVSDDEPRDRKEEKTEGIDERDRKPTLEDISRVRAQAQQKSTEAIRAAEDRYNKALQAAKERGSEAAGYVGDRAAAARDVTVETGKEAAGRAGEAAVSVKDRAVAAGWTAAHYSTEKAVEGTLAAARVVKGAAELAAKPLVAAKDSAYSAVESSKGYTYRKKDEAQMGLDAKQIGAHKQETESHGDETNEEYYSPTEHSEFERPKGQSGSVLGAIGETIVEIAQTTRDLVIGDDKNQQDRTTDRP